MTYEQIAEQQGLPIGGAGRDATLLILKQRLSSKQNTKNALSKNCLYFKIGSAVIENSRPKHEPNQHAYAIYGRPEVADDVVSGQNVKTISGLSQ